MKRAGLLGGLCFALGLMGAGAALADPVPIEQMLPHSSSDIRDLEFSEVEISGEARREFVSQWPREAEDFPGLIAVLSEQRAKTLAAQKSEWEEAVKEFAGSDCVTCVSRSYSEDWEVMADTQRFLSLGQERYFYSGGAHGNSSFDALIWDKQDQAALRPIEMFVDPTALENVAYGDYCAALHTQRSKRRGLDPAQGNKFTDCPSVDRMVVSVSSYSGEKLDRIEFLAAPYVAGPYVEGSYQMTLPVTEAILSAVKPEFREAFAAAP